MSEVEAAFALFDGSGSDSDIDVDVGPIEQEAVAPAKVTAPPPAPIRESATGVSNVFESVPGMPAGVSFVSGIELEDDDGTGWEFVPGTDDGNSGTAGAADADADASGDPESRAEAELWEAPAKLQAEQSERQQLEHERWAMRALTRGVDALGNGEGMRQIWAHAALVAMDLTPEACEQLEFGDDGGDGSPPDSRSGAGSDGSGGKSGKVVAEALHESAQAFVACSDAVLHGGPASRAPMALTCLRSCYDVARRCWSALQDGGWGHQGWRDAFLVAQLMCATVEASVALAPGSSDGRDEISRLPVTLRRLDVALVLGGKAAVPMVMPLLARVEPFVARTRRCCRSAMPTCASDEVEDVSAGVRLRVPVGHTPASWAGLHLSSTAGAQLCSRIGSRVPPGHVPHSWGRWGAGPAGLSGVEGRNTGDGNPRFTLPTSLDVLPSAALLPKLDPDRAIATYAACGSAGPLTTARFRDEHYKKAAALHVRHFAQSRGWDAMGCATWRDLRFLLVEHGHRTVPIEIGRTDCPASFAERTMTLAQFVHRFLVPSNAFEHLDRAALAQSEAGDAERAPHTCFDLNRVGYLAQHDLFLQIPSLKRFFKVPEYTQCSNTGVTNINCWLGTAGTVTSLHFDSYDNFLVQVAGFKYVRLYSPDQTPKLYVNRQGRGTSAQGNISRLRVEEPDFTRFPLAATAQYTECILGPGDMLFIPERHWHYVRSLTTSFSMNFWF